MPDGRGERAVTDIADFMSSVRQHGQSKIFKMLIGIYVNVTLLHMLMDSHVV